MVRGKSSLLSELERLRDENKNLKKQIQNISFVENPDIFAINRNSDSFFQHVTVVEAKILLSNLDNNTKINIGWELA